MVTRHHDESRVAERWSAFALVARHTAGLAVAPAGLTYPRDVLARDIVVAVEAEEQRQHPDDLPKLRREVPIAMGAARIDVIAVNGALTGYEIKSGSDGLARLERQVVAYSRVVDHAVLVVERRHPHRLLERLPSWWGLWAVQDTDGGCVLQELRAPGPNPDVEAFAVAQLLWRGEAVELLRHVGYGRGLSRADRWRLWALIADLVPLAELQSYTRRALKARLGW